MGPPFSAITASHFSAQVRKQALEVQNRQQEMVKLYALSRSILLIEPLDLAPKQLANQVAQRFSARSVALFHGATGDVYRA